MRRLVSNLKLKTKLIGGFLVVALITGVVGTAGYWGVKELAGNLNEIGTNRLPSVESLLKFQLASDRIRTVQKDLLNPDLPAADRKGKFDSVAKVREEYEAAWKIYESLPKTPEEERLWTEFVAAWQQWRGGNNEFFRLAREFDTILDQCAKDGFKVEGAYLSGLAKAVGSSLRVGSVFKTQVQEWKNVLIRGNAQADFDKHFAAFEKDEKTVQHELGLLGELLARCGMDPRAASEVATTHAALGVKYREALKRFDRQNPEAGKVVDKLLRGVDRPATQAIEAIADKIGAAEKAAKGVLAKMNDHVTRVCQVSETKANNLLDKIVQLNCDAAAGQVANGAQFAAQAKAISVWATAAGLVTAMALGIFLSLAVTRPVFKVLQVLKALAAGDYSRKVDLQSRDELGQMAAALNTAVDATAKAMKDVHEAAERETRLQAERAADERRQAEADKIRQAEQADRERQQREVEQKRQEEEMARERERAEADRRVGDELRRKVNYLLETVAAAAQGDLTRKVAVEGNDAVDELAAGIGRMLSDLANIIGQVMESASQFTEGSRVIAESSQTLAQGVQTQSSSVQQMSASIEQLARSIEAVKESATQANRLAAEANGLAEQGGKAVQKSTESMETIRSSAQQISEIIQVISEIAAQTNLLALNAAIEAARAGEHGMGFAVVADEVRKLAERSNQAAREISSLIKESTNRVEEGAQLSDQTGASLKQIITAAQATAAKIAEIAAATAEQATGAEEVSRAIQSVAQVTEQTAAGSEEMASSSEELGAQAGTLRELVGRFRVNVE